MNTHSLSRKGTWLLFLLAFCTINSFAQISINALPASYSNNFDSYNPSGAANVPSTINSTGTGSGLVSATTGWTASSSATAAYGGRSTNPGGGGYYGLGSGSEYALGGVRSGGVGNITYTISFTNNSGSTITALTLSWDYEQWTFNNTSGLNCTGTGSLSANATLNGKDFTGSSSGTDGTVSTTAVASFTLTGLSITNGSSFGISWLSTDAGGGDNAVGIDNLTMSACSAAPAQPGTITGNATVCQASSQTYSVAAVNGATSYTWTLPGAGWSGSSTTNSIAATAGTASGNVSITATNGCGTSAARTLAVTTNPSPSNKTVAAASSSVCSGFATNITVASSLAAETYQLRNNADNSNIGSAVTGNGGTINLPTGNLTANTTFNVLATVTATGCTAQMSATPSVTVNALPVNRTVAAASSSICTGTSTNITVASSTALTTTYQLRNNADNSNIGSAVTGNGGTINLPTGNLTASTTFNVLATITATGCQAVMSVTPTVTVNPVIGSNSVGSDETICAGSSASLTGSAPSGGSGAYNYNWESSTTSASAGFGNATGTRTNQNYTTAALTQTTWFRRTVTSGGCTDVSTTVVQITVNTAATVSAGADQTVCSNSPAVTLAGTRGGSSTSATWSGGTGTFNPNNTTLTAVYTPSAAEITAGTVTLTLTTDDPAGICPAVSDAMVITINTVAAATAGADQTVCAPSTVSITGTRSGTGVTSSTWTTSGSGTFANAANLSTTYTPSAGDYALGTVTLTITTNDPTGPCGAATDQLVVTFNTVPGPSVITGASSACPNTGSLGYSITAVAGATNYTWAVPSGWTINSGQGTTSIVATSSNTPGSGNVTVVVTNACGASNSAHNSYVFPVNATNNTGFTTSTTKTSDGIQCNNGTGERRGYLKFPLTAIPSNATINSSTLTLINNGSPTLSGANNDVKPLLSNDPVTETAANLFTAIGAQNSGTNYSQATWSNTGTISLALNATANSNIQSRLASPGNIAMGLARGGTAIYTFFGYSSGANAPVLTLNNTVPASSFAVTVNALPSTSAITGSASVCNGATGVTYSVTNTSGSSYAWTVPGGASITAGATGPNNNQITVTFGSTSGNVTVTETNSNGCVGTAVSKAVTVNTLPTTSAITGTASTCAGTTGVTYSVTNTSGSSYAWTVPSGASITAGATGPNNNQITVTFGSTSGNVAVTETNSNGCVGTQVTQAVTVNALPSAPTSGGNQAKAYDGNANTTALTATAGGGERVDWYDADLPGGTLVQSNSTSYTPVAVNIGTYTFYAEAVNTTTSCASATRTAVSLTIQPISSANADLRTTTSGTTAFETASNWEYDADGSGPGTSYVVSTTAPASTNNLEVRRNMTLNSSFDIGPGKTLSVSGGTLNFNDKLVTVMSTSAGTGAIGRTIGGSITGATNVTVERFIPGGKQAWRLIGAPTTGSQTIRQSWMNLNNGQVGIVSGTPTINDNGYGLIISSGPAALAGPAATSLSPGGFDEQSQTTSIKYYDSTTSTFKYFDNVNHPVCSDSVRLVSTVPNKYHQGGYFLFVRGDRNKRVGSSNPSTATTLRSNGGIKTGETIVKNAAAGKSKLVANPFACGINFTRIGLTGGIQDVFYLWDPLKGTTGGYETFSGLDGYKATVGGTVGVNSSWATNEVDTVIESGQSFFISNSGAAGTITIDENSKVYVNAGGNNKGFRPAAPATISKFTTRLLSGNKVYDGNTVVFNKNYSNDVDRNDALKFTNPGEDFAISSGGKELAVEGRQAISSEEVISYTMKNMKQQDYSLEFTASNMAEGEAYLVDNYLGTQTPISLAGATKVSFSVTADAKSSASSRFKVVFRPAVTATDTRTAAIKVSPNPVETGIMNVSFVKQDKGRYNVTLTDLSGRVIYNSVREHAGGSAVQQVNLPSAIAAGAYQLVITAPDKTRQVQKILINRSK